jgi:hypothetical protein
MRACLLADMKTNQEMLAKLEAKADTYLRETKAEIRTNQERMEAKTEANQKDDSQDGHLDRREGGLCGKIGCQSRKVGCHSR